MIHIPARNIFFLAIVFFFGFRGGQKTELPLFSGESAFAYLEKQVTFGPRYPGSEGHAKCLVFLFDEMRKFTPHVLKQELSSKDTKTNKYVDLANIIASFPGKNPGAQKVLFAAHWDTRSRADEEENEDDQNTPIVGANDGASGVAVLLELARILKENPPPNPVDLVLFDGEDAGEEGEVLLLGSKHYAANFKGKPFKFGILLDMVGDKDLSIPKEAFSQRMLPSIVSSVWKRARTLKLKAFSNRVGPEITDDHVPLINVGIPIINIIDFDYAYWHTLEDTPDKCSPESLEQVGILVTSLVYEGL